MRQLRAGLPRFGPHGLSHPGQEGCDGAEANRGSFRLCGGRDSGPCGGEGRHMSGVRLMKGNEALAEAAIRAGCRGYFGYPITPQSEILEYLADEGRKRGMVVMQVESEVAAINMVYGAAGTGARVMTSSSSPGISLMQEGLSYRSEERRVGK